MKDAKGHGSDAHSTGVDQIGRPMEHMHIITRGPKSADGDPRSAFVAIHEIHYDENRVPRLGPQVSGYETSSKGATVSAKREIARIQAKGRP
jgi:hypothetical protein